MGTVWPDVIERLNRVLAVSHQERVKESLAWQGHNWVTRDFNTATVRLVSAPETDAWSKSGIMLRVAETDGSANVALLGTHKNGIVMQERLHEGASSRTAGRTPWTNGELVYLRLTRTGNRVIGYASADGNTWVQVSSVTIDLLERVYIGPASTSHAVGVVGEAVFVGWELSR